MSWEKKFKEVRNHGGILAVPTPPKRRFAHILIAKTAIALAREQYEIFAKDNEWYKANPSRKEFVRRTADYYTEPARATLAGMLRGDLAPHLKEQIKNALILDQQLRGTAHGKIRLAN